MTRRPRHHPLLGLVLALLPLWGYGAPVLDEWSLPWADSRPRDPAVAPDGRVWFSAQTGNYLGVFDPADATFERYELPPGTYPHDLVIDEAGLVWYAGNGNGHIGRLDPASGTITPYPLPKPTLDPHTLALDGRGHLWFTLQQSNLIGRLELATGNLRFAAPATDKARPYGLLIDSRGHPRVALFGSNRLATLGPSSLRLIETPLPAAARPRRLALGAEDDLWYSDYARGYLGRYRPGSGRTDEWALPAGTAARPYGIATDNQGRIWVADTGGVPNRLLMFDPQTEQFEYTLTVPSGAGSIRRLRLDPTRDEIWFGTDRNTLGRLRPGP